MRIAINQGVFFESPTEVFLELCSSHHIKAIEFRLPKLKEWLYSIPISEAKKRLEILGLEVIALNSLDDFGLVPAENLDLLRREAEFAGSLCNAVHCPLVIAPVGRWFSAPLPAKEVYEKTLERFSLLVEVLAPFGVNVGIEPISFPEFSIQNIHTAEELCLAVGGDNAGLIVDYYNLFQGGMVPDDFVSLRAPIFLIHINDADFLPAANLDVVSTRVFPGDGSLHAAEWTKKALEAGYDGYFSLEIFDKELWKLDAAAAMYKTIAKLEYFSMAVKNACKQGETK
jgi:sugar phosphate isomerase/epimerase